MAIPRGESRIPHKRGRRSWRGQHGILPNFQKLHEVESIFGCGGWRRLLLRPGHLKCTYGRSGEFPERGKTNSSQTATVVVVKQSLGSWSRLWSLSNVSGCGSTSLFGSRAGTHQIRDQSRALEDRNDRNNSFRGVHT